jgi:hypothetical protein
MGIMHNPLGILECWSNGIMGNIQENPYNLFNPTFHLSIIPLFQLEVPI